MKAARTLAALRPALNIVGVGALGLGVCAGAVLGLGDGRCFTTPPESVAEQFLRSLGTRRWGPARARLAPELAAAVDESALRETARAFQQRHGRIARVEGQPGSAAGEAAEAAALVTTSRGGRRWVTLPVSRRRGVWRIAGLGGLAGG